MPDSPHATVDATRTAAPDAAQQRPAPTARDTTSVATIATDGGADTAAGSSPAPDAPQRAHRPRGPWPRGPSSRGQHGGGANRAPGRGPVRSSAPTSGRTSGRRASADPDAPSRSTDIRSVGGRSIDGRCIGGRDAVPDRVWAALLARPAVTAAELSAAAGAGRSTVSKLLAAWAEAGRVTSAAGTHARAARRWTAIPAPAALLPAAPTAAANSHVGAGRDRPARRLVRPDDSASTRSADTSSPNDTSGPVEETRVTVADAGGGSRGDSGRHREHLPRAAGARQVRLAAGQLRGLVEEFLAEHPGDHGPVDIGHALRRSSGAIANALERLVDTGWAERTSEHPKRYRFVDAEQIGAERTTAEDTVTDSEQTDLDSSTADSTDADTST